MGLIFFILSEATQNPYADHFPCGLWRYLSLTFCFNFAAFVFILLDETSYTFERHYTLLSSFIFRDSQICRNSYSPIYNSRYLQCSSCLYLNLLVTSWKPWSSKSHSLATPNAFSQLLYPCSFGHISSNVSFVPVGVTKCVNLFFKFYSKKPH